MDLSAHLRDVALVLADLEKNGITAKPSKSFFAMQRLRVIGLIVSKLGTQVNPDRLQAITEFQMQRPRNKTASPISTLYQPARARSRYFPISRIFLLIQVDQARR